MSAYNLNTHLGAYLYRQNCFRPNGWVGFVAAGEVLDGYLDASGNEKTVRDTVLIVASCLNLPEAWDTFTNEWQGFLKDQGFKPEHEFGRYVYHTTDVMACKDEKDLIPDGLTPAKAKKIHREAVKLVCNHTMYRSCYGVLLSHIQKFEEKYPHAKQLLFGKAGSFVSGLSFSKNQTWAEKHGFNPWIPYIFDRGDEFWGHLENSYRIALKNLPREEITIHNLTPENKAEFIPIQAADVIAWECSQYFRNIKPIHLILGESNGLHMRPEMNMLLQSQGEANFDLLFDKSLEFHLHEYMKPILEDVLDGRPESDYIGEGKYWTDMEAFAVYALDVYKRNKVETARQAQAERKALWEAKNAEKKMNEFEKFDKTMEGLLAVSRDELQEKLEEEKQAKAKQKKKPTNEPTSSRVSPKAVSD